MKLCFTFFTIIFLGNVAWAFVVAKYQLINNPELIGGEIFFITDETKIRHMIDFVGPFIEDRGYKMSNTVIPFLLAYVISLLIFWIVKVFGVIKKIEPTMPHPSHVHLLSKTYSFSSEKATRMLGYRPIYTQEESFENSKSYYSEVKL